MLLLLSVAAYLGLQAQPVSPIEADTRAGAALDLTGRYTEARKHLAQAIKESHTPVEKAQARRAMAISFAFTGDCRGAEKQDREAYEFFMQASDFYNAGDVADEVGRICLDAGDFDTSYDWYRKGHDAGISEENISAARRDLWDFRWNHARARIAARRGKLAESRKYVAAGKVILDRGKNPEQQVFFPYLTGYVEFYAGDYTAALAALRGAVQTDPFIGCLIAQCYEKLGDREKALEYYRKAAATTAHSVPAAYARPFAAKKLQEIGNGPASAESIAK